MKRNVFLTALLLGTHVLSAQECNQTLTGKIIDFHDGAPLEGATITFNDTVVETDVNGAYSIENLCATSYAFTISHDECNSQVVTLDLKEVSEKTFYLEHHLNELDAVKIKGVVTHQTVSAQEETINNIDKYSSASLGDALRELKGVSSLSTGATIVKPIIQGLSGSRVLIMNNGVRMQDMEWGDEHAPNVDINTAGHISVIKGASALKYGGDAIGGVVIMESSRVPAKDTLYGKTLATAAVNGRGGAISSEIIKGYKNGLFFKAQGSLKRFGDLEAPDYVLSNTGVFEKGVALSFGVNKFVSGWDVYYSFYGTEIAVLASSHIGNTNDLIASINNGKPNIIRDFTYEIQNPKQEVTHHLGKLRYFKRFEELGKWTTQYDFQHNQRFEFDIRRTEQLSTRPSIDLTLTTHTIMSDFNFDANPDYTIDVGFLTRYQNNFADAINTGVRRLIPDYDKYDAGLFITSEVNLSEPTRIDAGIRYDFDRIDAKKFYLESRWIERGYDEDFSNIVIQRGVIGSQLLTNPVFDFHSISGTAGMQHKFKEDYKLRFNYALAQRAPNPSELFSDGLHHSAARIELGDLRIKQETSHKVSVSVQKNNEKWGWELLPYANFIQNYILLEPVNTELTIRGAFLVWQYRQANTRLLGVDASLYRNWLDDWRTDHNFSYVQGIETDTDTPLINMPAPNFNNKVTFTKNQWYGFYASLESQYTFQQNEFPPDIEVFSPDTGESIILEINTPPDAYHLLNLDTGMEFTLGKKTIVKVGVTITNMANTKYRNYLNRQRYFADDLGRNILFRTSINF